MISKHKVLDHYLSEAIEQMRANGKEPYGSSNTSTPGQSLASIIESEITNDRPGPSQELSSMSFSAISSHSNNQVSLSEFMDSGILEENKPDRIMQVDGGIDSDS